MNPLLLAARDLRLLTGIPRNPICGQQFIHALQKVQLVHSLDTHIETGKILEDLESLIQGASTLVRTNSGTIPLSHALNILNELQSRGFIPPPTADASPLLERRPVSIDITPVFPAETLEQKIRIHFPPELVTTIVTSPRTNSEGFFIVRNRGIDDQDRELSTCTITNYRLGNWDPSIRRHRPIAAGGNSEVYIAHEEGTPRPVAIKIAAIRHAKDQTFGLNRFKNGKYFQALLGADRFVHCYDTGIMHDGTPYIIMELMKESLLDNISRKPDALTWSDTFRLSLELIAPVAIMHMKRIETSNGVIEGIVHGDIKPGNFLFPFEGKLKLSDFDLAKYTKDIHRLPPQGIKGLSEYVLGTAGYFVCTEPEGFPQDVFALGATLFQVYTGKRAFSGKTIEETLMNVLKKEENLLQEELIERNVPLPLVRIILRALSRSVEERHQDASDLFLDLSTFQARAVEEEAKKFIQFGSDSRKARDDWKIKIDDALEEYGLAYQEYPHPKINERMIHLNEQLHDYALKVGNQEAMRSASNRIGRLTPNGGLPRVQTRS